MMPMSLRLFLLLSGAASLVACSDDHKGTKIADQETQQETPEPAPVVTPCAEDDSHEQVVIAAVDDNADITHGTIAVFALNASGRLRDTGTRLGPLLVPRAVTMRDDGKEALVSYGNNGNEGDTCGVVVLSIAPDTQHVSIIQNLTPAIDAGLWVPLHITYTSADSAIASRLGFDIADLMALTRQQDGLFTAGAPVVVPGGIPQVVAPIAGESHKQLVLAIDSAFAIDGASRAYAISDADGQIATLTGDPIVFAKQPYYLYPNPKVPRAYVPYVNPDDRHVLNPSGMLHLLSQSDNAAWLDSDHFLLPNRASVMAVAPDGTSAVFSDEVKDLLYADDGAKVERIIGWELYRVDLDAAGTPTKASAPLAFAADMVLDMQQNSTGHVVVARKRGEVYEVVSFAKSGDSWQECPNAITVPGGAALAIAP
jgi:hypothetical protein